MVGCGAVGGYFGGRMCEAGLDLTFFVRQRRRNVLKQNGLKIKSVHGNVSLPQVPTLVAGEKAEPFDVVFLAVKSYHLQNAVQSVFPYVAPDGVVIPLLNGFQHMEKLQEAFGSHRVLGGLCFIESTADEHGNIGQFSKRHEIVFGEAEGGMTERVRNIAKRLQRARFVLKTSEKIFHDMWMKYIFIASFSGITCLMREAIGSILSAPFGEKIYRRLVLEITSIAWKQERALDENVPETIVELTCRQNPAMKSSMLRDLEQGRPLEADHLHGWLLEKAGKEATLPLLRTVYCHLKTYENSRG